MQQPEAQMLTTRDQQIVLARDRCDTTVELGQRYGMSHRLSSSAAAERPTRRLPCSVRAGSGWTAYSSGGLIVAWTRRSSTRSPRTRPPTCTPPAAAGLRRQHDTVPRGRRRRPRRRPARRPRQGRDDRRRRPRGDHGGPRAGRPDRGAVGDRRRAALGHRHDARACRGAARPRLGLRGTARAAPADRARDPADGRRPAALRRLAADAVRDPRRGRPRGAAARRAGRPLRRAAKARIEIALPLSQEELAAWTGSSREAVSKALQLLRSLDIVETGRRRITVLDPDALRRRAAV